MQSANMKHTNLIQKHRTGVGNKKVDAAKTMNWMAGPLLHSLQQLLLKKRLKLSNLDVTHLKN